MRRPKAVTASAITSAPQGFAFSVRTIRLSQVWAAVAVLIPVLVISGTPLFAIDLAYHLRAGDIMFDTHTVLRTDVFSAAAYGRPWLNQQWLAQIVLATAFRLGGGFGVPVVPLVPPPPPPLGLQSSAALRIATSWWMVTAALGLKLISPAALDHAAPKAQRSKS